MVALIHACFPLFVDCGYQPFFAYTLMAHAVLFWVMFYNFYNKSYNNRNHHHSKTLLSDESTHHENCHTNGFKKSSSTATNGTNGTNVTNGSTNGIHNGKTKQG